MRNTSVDLRTGTAGVKVKSADEAACDIVDSAASGTEHTAHSTQHTARHPPTPVSWRRDQLASWVQENPSLNEQAPSDLNLLFWVISKVDMRVFLN